MRLDDQLRELARAAKLGDDQAAHRWFQLMHAGNLWKSVRERVSCSHYFWDARLGYRLRLNVRYSRRPDPARSPLTFPCFRARLDPTLLLHRELAAELDARLDTLSRARLA